MIGQADIQQAIYRLWDNYDLDDRFNNPYWFPKTQRDEYLVLHDTAVDDETPWPYCIVQIGNPVTASRAAYDRSSKRREADTPLTFMTHARDANNRGVNGKDLARQLAEVIIEHYGGHPEKAPKRMRLDYGGVLHCQYQTDYCVPLGNQEFRWVIEYLIKSDVPEQVT